MQEITMKKQVGVWIDHRKAIIVRVRDDVEEIHSITSDVEKHARYAGGEPEDRRDHRFTNHLNAYYDKVISFLQDADAILILGPGEAKGEFEKRLLAEPFGAVIVGVETADKMTYHDIAAKVREYFLVSHEDIRHSNEE